MTGIRFPPDRAGWLVVTRSYRWAWTGLIGGALAVLLAAFSVVHDAIRDRPFHWFFAVYLLVALVWTVRFLGNVMWLRRERLAAPDAPN